MKNAPDFVMYVVIVKFREKYDPLWNRPDRGPSYAIGFKTRRDAKAVCKLWRAEFGETSAYVQQYGPYS